MKNCTRCGARHALVSPYCSNCIRDFNVDQRARRKANGKAAEYYLRRRQRMWEAWLQRYGITAADYAALLHAQGGGCAICGDPPHSRKLAVDHDHADGRVRGLLCAACNQAIGAMRDRPDLLQKAIAYLTV